MTNEAIYGALDVGAREVRCGRTSPGARLARHSMAHCREGREETLVSVACHVFAFSEAETASSSHVPCQAPLAARDTLASDWELLSF